MKEITTNQTGTLVWTINKGTSGEVVDLAGVTPVVHLLYEGGRNKIPLDFTIQEDGTVKADIPALEPGVYGLRAYWQKKGKPLEKSEVRNVLFVSETDSVRPITYTIKVKSYVNWFGYDGLNAYEMSCLKGATTLTEDEWIEKLNSADRFEDYSVTEIKLAPALKTKIDDMESEVFPLTVSNGTNNAGVREVGTAVVPTSDINITRNGVDVSASASVTVPSGVTVASDNKSWSANASVSSGTNSYAVSVTQAGQTKSLPTLTWSFSNYRYGGALDSVPSDYKTAILALRTIHELSTTSTLGATSLAANKYYLFAVKGTPTLICKESSTSGVVSGSVTGTVTLPQENDSSKTNTYTYILVPKSDIAWSFKITNS